ncbi:hypothetical protein D3C85_1201690 [compost metagenome]
MAARGRAGHAQGPLRHHARLHAQEGLAGPRHDAAHLHHPGQPRLRFRSRHDHEVPHLAGASAHRHGPVRLFALHRGQAQRLPVGARQRLDRHRSRPYRHAGLRLRRRLRLRALRRLRPRHPHVFRQARRDLCRPVGPVVPQVHDRGSGRPARRARHGQGLGRPPDHPLPRSAPETVSGDARRRRRSVEPHLRPARPVGRHPL